MKSLARTELLRHCLACLMLPLVAFSGSPAAQARAAWPSSAQVAKPTKPVTDSDSVRQRAVFSPATCVVAVTAGTATWSARKVAFRTPESADALAANLQCLLQGSVRGGRWGIMAVSLTRGDTILALDAGTHFMPASTQKLFTSALALDQLGAEHQFRTIVLRTGEIDAAGVLHGNLILQGGGDPAFSDKFVTGDQLTPVNLLAEKVLSAGITRIAGNLVADPFVFDSRLVPDGWLARYRNAAYAAPVSALSLNENVASVVVAPGEGFDDALATLDPPAITMTVQSSVRTVPGTRSNIAVRRIDELTFEVHGWIGSRSAPRRIAMVVEDPANFTAGAFRSALNERGVRIGGATVIDHAPTAARRVTELLSPTLSRLVTAMNRESINHYAELIFRNAGRGADELLPGSADAGFSRLSDFLTTKVGTDHGAVYAVDGSGLSPLDRVTPRSLVQLLSYAHRAPWGPVFHASLPLAGESATLHSRMRNTIAEGNLHAKTGTTSEIISLSGYVTAENGEVLAFAFLYNGKDLDRARATIDQMGPALAALARR